MATDTVNAYLRTKVMTASPEQLRLMLLDGAIKFGRQGREGLINKDFEAVFNGFSRCRNILVELLSSIRPEVNPELCQRVASLYTYMIAELSKASMEKDVAKADKVIELLEFERETWVLLMDKLAKERQAGQDRAAAEQARVPAEPAAEYRPLSIQG